MPDPKGQNAMLLGPVFRSELLRTSRRLRYYVMRLLYGMLLLFIIWTAYESTLRGRLTVSISEAATFAQNTFITFSIVQLITILLLIPALFGGAIVDEKQRKTLHYLMASRLSSFEIVIDKVLGRSAHLVVFLALGLPIICLLGLVGGVPPDYVVFAAAGTFATASMAVALTVLVSTLSRRVRQSILVAYILLLAWQFVPIIVYGVGSRLYPLTYRWIEPVNTWIGATSPLFVYITSAISMRMARFTGFNDYMIEQFFWMVGLQLGAACLMILLAVWGLRPTFRRHEATQPRRKWFEGKQKKTRAARAPRWWDRPECGGDAMAWKERYFARTDIFTKLVVLPATVFVSIILVLRVGIDESLISAFSDLWHLGFRGWGSNEALADQLRVFSAWYIAIWLLAVAGASASSVAIERDEDTWISLISTPLTGWEILRGKVLGAIWAQRGFAAIPLGFWIIGLLVGALHPLGFLASVIAFGLITWLVAAVGVHASLKATTTSKALAATITKLAVLWGYPFFLLWFLLDSSNWEQYYLPFVGLPPRIVVGPLVSYRYVGDLWRTTAQGGFRYHPDRIAIVFGLLALTFYTALAAFLTYRSVGRFDHWLDRPRLTRESESTPIQKQPREEPIAEPALQS
jgi:ABC-type transport system involved in multi-copper enzyme maturation permease subunit